MQLDTLELQNFRQFYGEQTIEFSQHSENNVTVIHGSNGSGKTTILNAFMWLFYDEVKLPRPDQIPSERALAETERGNTVDVSVRLEFDHEGRSYTAVRSAKFERTSSQNLSNESQEMDLHLEYINEAGNRKVLGGPGDSLRQIMPERLREIFFFDGETIDELSEIGGQDKIQTAIQNIMGLTILERAERHLDTVRRRFEKEVSKYGSDELSDLYDRRSQLEAELETTEKQLTETRDSKHQTEEELDDVKQRLRDLDQSRDLQKERDEIEDNVEGLENDIEEIEDDIADRISDSGYLPFATPAVEKTAHMLKEKREQGEIPTEIKTQFVDDLLDLRECICGRELTPGTTPHDNVRQWRAKAGSSELEEVAMNIAGRLTEIGEGEEKLYDDIENLLERRSDKEDEKQQKLERISEISSRLEDVDTEDISRLETRRQELQEQVSDYDQQIGSIQTQIEDLEAKIDELGEEIAKAEEENEKADRARRRAQMAEYLGERVVELIGRYKDEVRKSVNDRVNDTFKDIIAKDYYAEIGEDYSLNILKNVGSQKSVPVAKSTGERQVASLSFIASLVSLARDQYESDRDKMFFTGGIYPMIMDSPFGYLDPEYQQRISAVLPEMAPQVVVLVTQSQWSTEVAGEMEAVAGEEYHLRYHDPAEEPGTDYEYTEIVPETGGGY